MSVARKASLKVVDGGGRPPGGDAPGPGEWKQLLTRNREDKIEGTLHNLCLILENDEHFSGLFWLNESSNQVLLSRDPPWLGGSRHEFTDTDSFEIAAWLQDPYRYRMAVKAEMVLQGVITIARRHRRHPIREYLQALVWDGTPRIETMFPQLFGTDDTPYTRHAAQCFMVSAISRVLWSDPKTPSIGAKVDFMLVLEGPQGKKKSTALQVLFGAQWYVETHESPAGKDFYLVIQGHWCVEIAEMDSFSKADVTSVKAAITRRVDKFRPPYERMPRSYRRECIFAGTTNESEYLRDPTGGRRFLPARCKDDGFIDLDQIELLRDQLWAEAIAMFQAGYKWWELPDDAADEQEKRYVGDSWEDRVSRWLTGRVKGDNAYPARLQFLAVPIPYTTTDELLTYAIGVDAARHDRPAQMRVAAIMKRLGWFSKRDWFDGRDGPRERRWLRASEETREEQPARSETDIDVPF